MRLPRLVSLVLLLAAAGPAAAAAPSGISLRVEPITSNDPEKHTHTQKRSLKIHLTNTSSQERAGLKVKYYWFARDVKDRDVNLFKSDESPAVLKPRATEIIETGTVTSSYTEDHYGKGKGKGKGGKKVEGTGNKITGYGVQVYENDRIVAEYYSEPSYKAMLTGAPGTP